MMRSYSFLSEALYFLFRWELFLRVSFDEIQNYLFSSRLFHAKKTQKWGESSLPLGRRDDNTWHLFSRKKNKKKGCVSASKNSTWNGRLHIEPVHIPHQGELFQKWKRLSTNKWLISSMLIASGVRTPIPHENDAHPPPPQEKRNKRVRATQLKLSSPSVWSNSPILLNVSNPLTVWCLSRKRKVHVPLCTFWEETKQEKGR